MKAELRVGTSGWSYKHWIGVFYPPALRSREWLTFYASHFDTVEINSTFYHLPGEAAVQSWFEQTPDAFLFAMKLSRFITHMKKLRHAEEALDRFIARIQHLRHKTGPILIQLPPNFNFHAELLQTFMTQIRSRLPQALFAIEPRNPSWFSDQALETYRQCNLALCFADSTDQQPDLTRITGRFIYLRFHGRNGLYQGDYTREHLQPYAEKIREWLQEGLSVYAYFNNDIGGFAVKNALMLRDMVQTKDPPRPQE